ncbi:DUF222 domain-containing protein [Amycolatopsis sp. NPDC024027]|uniref:HNH endonuclease signature motif containing protein n=1 Tax=Amycolatopsis sp. NPDC024027 TaxID=3154327 RepID=UPI0033E1CAED
MSDNAALSSDAVAIADRIGELLACMRSAEAELGALLVEIEQRGVMELFGYRSVARLLEHLGDVPKQAGERMVKRARALNPGRNLDGSLIPALAPATGVAARAGRLSNPMIDVITGVLTQVPPEHHANVEVDLLTFAADAGHRQVAALGARILAHLNPDGAEPDDTELVTPSRELFLRRKRSGVWELNGRFDDETGTRALLDSLAERRTGDEGPDHRTLPQRYGDAFSDAVDLALNSPDLPMQAGERAHVMVAVSLADLKTGVGTATLGDSGSMTAAEARVHACDSMLIPAVLGDKSEPLNLGRLRRLISAGLRRALYLRDRGCAFPDCHRPPRHCQGHHIRHWADGGPTDLTNLVLMCAHHHRLLHRSGWEVRIAPDGLPEFLPPVFIDRRRKPRRNNIHEPLPCAA